MEKGPQTHRQCRGVVYYLYQITNKTKSMRSHLWKPNTKICLLRWEVNCRHWWQKVDTDDGIGVGNPYAWNSTLNNFMNHVSSIIFYVEVLPPGLIIFISGGLWRAIQIRPWGWDAYNLIILSFWKEISEYLRTGWERSYLQSRKKILTRNQIHSALA